MILESCRGNYERLGVGRRQDTITFSVQNPKGASCSLILYKENEEQPYQFPMEPDPMKSIIWSVGIKGLEPEHFSYNFEIDGAIENDLYAERIVGREKWGAADRKETIVKCGFNFSTFDWQDDELPGISKEDMVIYKLHVRGFSMGQPKKSQEKGTVAAIERKIPYLKELGITTIEFMPLYEFEEYFSLDKSQKETFPSEKLNYWGYTRGNYFAPKSSYMGGGGEAARLKQLIRALHKNQMECVMEFYFEENTNPSFILEVLRFWAREYHVDGFHLLCGQKAAQLAAEDIYLSGRKLFYESFGELQQPEDISGPKMFTYNDAFSYSLRKILNRQGGNVGEFLGNMRRQDTARGFVNYVANNNGFTLYDLFSYTEKKNQANLEDNQDGNDWNYSCNCGQEGATRRKDVNALRLRMAKNALAAVFLAQGVPLLWMGDECGNSQLGNNNAYCQDNEIGWKGWQVNLKSKELYQFVAQLARLRRRFSMLHNPRPMQLYDYRRLGCPDLSYHGQKGWQLDFDSSTPCVGMMYNESYANEDKILKEDYIYVGYNFSQQPQELALPSLTHGGKWCVLMDTGAEEVFKERPVKQREAKTFSLRGRSVCLLHGVSGGMLDE